MVRIWTEYGGLRKPYERFQVCGKFDDGKYRVYVIYLNTSTDWLCIFSGTLAECRQFVKLMFKSYIELK